MYKWDIQKLKVQIGNYFQFYRLQKELSQLQVANELDISSNHVGRIERAETNITLENILKFCNFLEIDILILFAKIENSELENLEKEIKELKIRFKNKNRSKF